MKNPFYSKRLYELNSTTSIPNPEYVKNFLRYRDYYFFISIFGFKVFTQKITGLEFLDIVRIYKINHRHYVDKFGHSGKYIFKEKIHNL